MPQETALCDEPGAEANLTFHGDLAGVPARVLGQRIDELLELVQLADR